MLISTIFTNASSFIATASGHHAFGRLVVDPTYNGEPQTTSAHHHRLLATTQPSNNFTKKTNYFH